MPHRPQDASDTNGATDVGRPNVPRPKERRSRDINLTRITVVVMLCPGANVEGVGLVPPGVK